MATDDDARLRQYLLGELSDEQNAALEEEYFENDAILDRVSVAEDELIESYLSGRLPPPDRERFDRHYLAAPNHRSRVAIAREVRRAAAEHRRATSRRANDGERRPSFVHAVLAWPRWLTVVAGAALLSIAIGGVWVVRTRPGSSTLGPSGTPVAVPGSTATDRNPPAPPRRPPIVVAATLSPAGVRGRDEATTVTIPPGTDLVVLHLERDAASPSLSADHAVVRRVSRAEVWRGPAASERDGGPAGPVRFEVPVTALSRGDYVVTLFGTDEKGREVERYRYFLRIR
jgi:hypothetical protein